MVPARGNRKGGPMGAVMIGVDPHKASHTAVAISAAEESLGELRVRACAAQAERLVAWARAWPQRTRAVEGAGGMGYLVAQQLLAAGERVLDVQPKLGARVRLLAAGNTNKNDPNDARPVAIAALRSGAVREVRPDDHAAVLKVWSKRYRDPGRSRTQVACRLHAVLCELIPGGIGKAITAAQAARILGSVTPSGAVQAARCELAAAFIEDLRGIDAQIRQARKKLAAVVQAAGTSLTGLFGVGPVIAAAVIGDVRDVSRFPGRDHFAAYNGTAPIEVSSGPRKACRLSRRGNRRLNHAIHMAAVTRVRDQHSQGRACYDKKLAGGKTPKEALRALKRQVSNAIFACLQADAQRQQTTAGTREGSRGTTLSPARPARTPGTGSSDKPLPGLATTLRPDHRETPGTAGHSPIAATPPSATPQVQVERPQRSEDERPGGAARRRPQSAARKARNQAP
jgi:transposase